MARSRLRVPRGIKRIFRGLPAEVRAEMVAAFDRGGRQLQAAMRARAPRRKGGLQAGIIYRVLKQSLKLRVGIIGPPREREALFYGRIQDLGRKGQTVTVNRYLKGGRAKDRATPRGLGDPREIYKNPKFTTVYQMKVRYMAPKRFVTGRFPELRDIMGRQLRGIWDRALKRIGGGGLG